MVKSDQFKSSRAADCPRDQSAGQASQPSNSETQKTSGALPLQRGCTCPNCGHFNLATSGEETNRTNITPRSREQVSCQPHGCVTDNQAGVFADILIGIERTLKNLDQKVADLQQRVADAETRQEWYSIREAAGVLGKAEFTVREWCRNDRVNALKRESGRGGKREWMISHDELDRIRNKGLLPANL